MVKDNACKNYLVVNADDLGQQRCFNRGILKAAGEGILTSTSIRANGLAFDEAVNEVIPAMPHIGVGVHVCLNEGKVLSPVSNGASLCDENGHFRFTGAKGFIRLAFSGGGKKISKEVEAEVRAQIEKIIAKTKIDHIDGHQHIHAIPWIFKIVSRLAAEYGIHFIRIPREPFIFDVLHSHIPSPVNFLHWFNIQNYCREDLKQVRESGISFNDKFYGLLHTDAMCENVVFRILSACRLAKTSITEVLLHPALDAGETNFIEEYVRSYCASDARKRELSALLSLKIKDVIKRRNFILTNYGALYKQSQNNHG